MTLSPFALPLVLMVLAALALAFLAWRHRPARPARAIMVLMLCVAVFAVAYMLELMSVEPTRAIFWAKVEYTAFLILPAIWLMFVIEYTGPRRLITPRNMLLLGAVPALSALVLWTNDYHYLFYQPPIPGVHGEASALPTLTYGPFFWVAGAYTCVVAAMGCYLLLMPYRRTHRMYSMQILALMVGFMLPWIGYALYMAGVDMPATPRLAPFGFMLAAIAVVWGLFRYRLLDIRPVARAAVVEGMDDAVFVLDAEDRVVDLNMAAQKVLERPATATVGWPARQVFAKWNGFAARLEDVTDGCTELSLERHGERRYYDLRASTLTGPLGVPNGRLLVLRDMTERLAMEEAERDQRALSDALHDATASLVSTLEVDEVLDRILKVVHDIVPYDCAGVLMIEDDIARLVRARDSTGAGLGLTLEGLRLRVSATHNLRYMLHTGQPHAVRDTREYAFWVTLPGTTWIRSLVAAPLCVKGQVLGFVSLYSRTADFYTTEHMERLRVFANQVAIALQNAQIYSAMETVNARLQGALKAKDEMIQNVSHELRSPLAVVTGSLELLRDGQMGPLTAMQEEALRVLNVETNRLQFMVERLLTLQSLQRDKLRLDYLDLGRWLCEHARLWAARAATQHIELKAEVAPGLPLVQADIGMLAQVYDNLLDNALKFSPDGGTVAVRAWAQDGEVVSAVCDQGIGIPPDKREHVFERFYQVNGARTRRFGGMGIGLALVQGIVEAHGGRVWVESEGEGCGSAFYVALPAEREAADVIPLGGTLRNT